jgi:hypothetical protein
MASNNYLPQRPHEPSTYLNPAVNQGTVPPAPPAPQPLQGQALTATATPPQAPNYQAPAQAQVQQWQQQQPIQQAMQQPIQQVPQQQQVRRQPTPAELQALQAQREAQQKNANVINASTIGGLGFAGVGTTIAVAEKFIPPESDLRQTHDSTVGNRTYQVDLEEKPKGFVERGKGLFGLGKGERALQVKRVEYNGTSLHIQRRDPAGRPTHVAMDLGERSDGVQAHYVVDDQDKYQLKKVEISRGREKTPQYIDLEKLDKIKGFDPDELVSTQAKLEQVVKNIETEAKPKKKFLWLFGGDPKEKHVEYRQKIDAFKIRQKALIQELDGLEALGKYQQNLNLDGKALDDLINTTQTFDFPDFEKLVKNAHMPRNIDLGEVIQKVLTKGGIGAVLGGLAIGGGTWAFQTLREKTPEQKRVEAQIAQNKANQLQAGRPPQQGMQQGFPPQQQRMNPAMLAQQGMYPPY